MSCAAEPPSSSNLVFFVNGEKVVEENADPAWYLSDYLRKKLNLTGTKIGCNEGGCGSCTVMISQYDRQTGKILHYSAVSCLTLLVSLHGKAVTTIEGIGTTNCLHPVQERIAKCHGTQCGFCTPGMVMSMYSLLRNNLQPSTSDILTQTAGNLCRCTGYRPILESFNTFASDIEKVCAREDCCLKKGATGICSTSNSLYNAGQFKLLSGSQDVIFPPEIKVNDVYDNEDLVFRGQFTYYRPVSLIRLVFLKTKYPEAKIVAGGTLSGFLLKSFHYPTIMISCSQVPDLKKIEITEEGILIGAAATLSGVEEFLETAITDLPEEKSRSFCALLDVMHLIASKQVRNAGTFGGNVASLCTYSDTIPILLVSNAEVILTSEHRDSRKIKLAKLFSEDSESRDCIAPEEVLVSVLIPFSTKYEYLASYKQSKRKYFDIAVLNSGMKIILNEEKKIQNLTLAFGGLEDKTVLLTLEELKENIWSSSLKEKVEELLLQKFKGLCRFNDAKIVYQITLALSFFTKFCETVSSWAEKLISLQRDLTPLFTAPESTQIFQEVSPDQDGLDPVGRPLAHSAALQHATGEANFVDDLPAYKDELQGALVLSQRPHAKILGIDPSAALALRDVVAFFDAKDLPGKRNVTGVADDEEVFASQEVHCIGQVIGLVVAKDSMAARKAAKLVKIDYEDLPYVLDVHLALDAGNYWGPWNMVKGDPEAAFESAEHKLEGQMVVGGQDHFYLEPNAHLAVPQREDGHIEVFSTTQNTCFMQQVIANALGVSRSRVVVKVKRIGGGFGGKDSRPAVCCTPAAVAAQRLGRPVRITLERSEDLLITGSRHQMAAKWKVGFSRDGVIKSYIIELLANAGCSKDLSNFVIYKSLRNIDNAYRIENFKGIGYCCFTNLPSRTTCRGTGAPQAVLITEDMFSRVADYLKVDAVVVKERNLYKEGDVTQYRQIVRKSEIGRCLKEVLEQGNYYERRKNVEEFNRANLHKKRGISATVAQYGMGFPNFLNQATALVMVYLDGSVLLTHAGVEMGQGLHTKMKQVASRCLGISEDNIIINETASDKIANATATAASMSSDLNGMAIMFACNEIMIHLQPYKDKFPNKSWKDWVQMAYHDGVPLSATGFYKDPYLEEYDYDTGEGKEPFIYFSYGAAISEVEIDCLTGDNTILQSDLVVDVGKSLNPAIDIGQIEGAFVQGIGLHTLEELLFDTEGRLVSNSTKDYKIPGHFNIPRKFNVTLLKDSGNPRAVYSSKVNRAVSSDQLYKKVVGI